MRTGVAVHGEGSWAMIVCDPDPANPFLCSDHRTNVDLKDKWRVEKKQIRSEVWSLFSLRDIT
eukprot:SAG22_NODE_4733_length_1179_cov_1.460185_1_plen_63_part_00